MSGDRTAPSRWTLARLLLLALAAVACETSEPAPNDGGTTIAGDAGSGDAGSTADAASPPGPRSCADIEAAYAAALKASTSCDPDAASDPCTRTASTAPGCGCPSKVNGEKVAEKEELSRLTYEYGDAGCDLNACPASCPPLADYRCQSRGECAAE